MQQNSFNFEGFDFNFFIGNPDDAIQKQHLNGCLFDWPELSKMSEYINDGDTIVDIGANVGNHTVFWSKKYPSSTVVPFEPHPEASDILTRNLTSNSCSNVERKYLGVGLSDAAGSCTMIRGGANNLGGSRLLSDSDTSQVKNIEANKNFSKTKVLIGDNALDDIEPRFLKIDVEGHEMHVLRGLEKTFHRCRPTLFIEVNNSNDDNFKEWVEENNYQIEWIDSNYQSCTNYLAIPA